MVPEYAAAYLRSEATVAFGIAENSFHAVFFIDLLDKGIHRGSVAGANDNPDLCDFQALFQQQHVSLFLSCIIFILTKEPRLVVTPETTK